MRNLERRADDRGVQAMPAPGLDRRAFYAKDNPAFAGPSDGHGSAVAYRADLHALSRCPAAEHGKIRF